MGKKVAVVGAGVIGLAAATALVRAGAEVRCFEKGEPGQVESAGLTRIFRHAHGDPALVLLAMQARGAWTTWEARYGRRLIGGEGMIVTGAETVTRWEKAMREAGAPHRALTAAQIAGLLPYCRPREGPALFDPAAGSTRARRTIDCLRADLTAQIVKAEVLDLTPSTAGMHVRTAADNWECDHVLLAAGSDTPDLALGLGVQLPVNRTRHARFTYRPRDGRPAHSPACWIDESGAYEAGLSTYCQPVGTTGNYAVGVHRLGEDYPATLDPSEVGRLSRATAHRYLSAALPGLDPDPIGELQCVTNESGFPDGDGFAAIGSGAATVFYGNNLFKFAPLLGDLLCRAAMQGEVPAELQRLTHLVQSPTISL